MSIRLSQQTDINLWIEKIKEFQLDDIFETPVLGRSYNIIPNIEVFSSSTHLIKARYPPSYLITIETDTHGICSSCSCPYPLACKHQAALILKLMSHK